MASSHILIVGTGQEARLALDIFTLEDLFTLGFVTTDPEKVGLDLNDVSIFAELGTPDSLKILEDAGSPYFVAVGDIKERKKVCERCAEIAKRPPNNAIHPYAWRSPYAKLGFGNLINASAALNANAQVGDNNVIHSGASIEADAIVGHYCSIMSGVRIGSNAVIEDDVFLGTGAVIYPGVKIGKGSLIGAGSVVLKEVEPGSTVMGNPAQSV